MNSCLFVIEKDLTFGHDLQSSNCKLCLHSLVSFCDLLSFWISMILKMQHSGEDAKNFPCGFNLNFGDQVLLSCALV
jgi:hypothetical protein